MTPFDPTRYRRTTEMAAEDMISEGSPLQQPSRAQSEAELAGLRYRRFLPQNWRLAFTPGVAFWAGVATGLAVAMFSQSRRHSVMRRERELMVPAYRLAS